MTPRKRSASRKNPFANSVPCLTAVRPKDGAAIELFHDGDRVALLARAQDFASVALGESARELRVETLRSACDNPRCPYDAHFSIDFPHGRAVAIHYDDAEFAARALRTLFALPHEALVHACGACACQVRP